MQSGRLAADPAAVREALASQLLEVWLRLRWLASARGKLRDVRRLMEVEADTGAASSTRPLLRQVLGKVLLQVSHGAAFALELLCGCCLKRVRDCLQHSVRQGCVSNLGPVRQRPTRRGLAAMVPDTMTLCALPCPPCCCPVISG